MFLHREDYYNMGGEPTNIAEVIIAKQRNGALGTVNLIWHGEYTWLRGSRACIPMRRCKAIKYSLMRVFALQS